MSEAQTGRRADQGVRCKFCPHVSEATDEACAEAIHADHMTDEHQDILRAVVGGVK